MASWEAWFELFGWQGAGLMPSSSVCGLIIVAGRSCGFGVFVQMLLGLILSSSVSMGGGLAPEWRVQRYISM